MSRILGLSKKIVKRGLEVSRKISSQECCDSGKEKDFMFRVRKTMFNLSGYNKYGLYSHDVINYENPVVKEALRRVPRDVLDDRNFRLIRALQLDFLKIYLPKEKWITFEEDLEYRYLSPLMEEIIEEKCEIYEFGCVNYNETDWPSNEIR